MRWLILMALVPGLAFAEGNPQIDRVWRAKCASCHGADGKGQTDQGKKMAIGDMTTGAWQAQFSDDKIKAAISDGLKRDNKGVAQEMEAYKAKLRPEQIDGLVGYLRALKK
jgi:mono/diheme cytochrome c family protein